MGHYRMQIITDLVIWALGMYLLACMAFGAYYEGTPYNEDYDDDDSERTMPRDDCKRTRPGGGAIGNRQLH
jgi:hypothetical protein